MNNRAKRAQRSPDRCDICGAVCLACCSSLLQQPASGGARGKPRPAECGWQAVCVAPDVWGGSVVSEGPGKRCVHTPQATSKRHTGKSCSGQGEFFPPHATDESRPSGPLKILYVAKSNIST